MEGAALVKQPDDLVGEDPEREGRRDRHEEHEFDRAVLQVAGFAQIAALQRAGQFRQQHDTHGHADHAERQLVDTVGILQGRDRALARGGDCLADHLVDLGDAAGDGGRHGQDEQPLDVGRDLRKADPDRDAGMQHAEIDHGQLQDAGHQDAPGHVPGGRQWRRADIERIEQRADHHHIEEDGRDGGGEEMVQRVEHAAHHRGQRHAHEIGKHHRRHTDGDRHFLRIVGKARRDHEPDEQRHAQLHDHRDQEQHGEQNAEHFLGKPLGAVDAVGLDLLGKQRHEGGVEGTLGK